MVQTPGLRKRDTDLRRSWNYFTMQRVGQTLDTWVATTRTLTETQKSKLQSMEKENLLWVSSWVTEGKRRLTHAMKPFQKRQKCRHPLRSVSNSVVGGLNNKPAAGPNNVVPSKEKIAPVSVVSAKQLDEKSNSGNDFDAKSAKEWASKLKVTELRDQLKTYGCSGKDLRGRKNLLVARLIKILKQEHDEEAEFLAFPGEAHEIAVAETTEGSAKNVEEKQEMVATTSSKNIDEASGSAKEANSLALTEKAPFKKSVITTPKLSPQITHCNNNHSLPQVKEEAETHQPPDVENSSNLVPTSPGVKSVIVEANNTVADNASKMGSSDDTKTKDAAAKKVEAKQCPVPVLAKETSAQSTLVSENEKVIEPASKTSAVDHKDPKKAQLTTPPAKVEDTSEGAIKTKAPIISVAASAKKPNDSKKAQSPGLTGNSGGDVKVEDTSDQKKRTETLEMRAKKKQEDEARRLREKLKDASKQKDKADVQTAKVPAPAPAFAEKQNSEPKSYRMSEHNSNSESSEEESSDDEESSSKKKKRKPPAPWARSSPLKRALKIQFGMKGPAPINPDQIFAERTSCDLEKIFDMKKKRYQRRGSSGVWLKDRVTDEEKLKYARRMGFAPLAYRMT